MRDWILWQASPTLRWPNFNIADSLLVCGAAMLLWQSFFPPPEDPAGEDPAGEDSAKEQPANGVSAGGNA